MITVATKIIIIAKVDRMLIVCQAHTVYLLNISTTSGNRYYSYFVEKDIKGQRK